jgi:transposase-like protein
VRRGRPGRRTVEERTTAVLELLGGKATVDQLASRFGVQGSTIEAWRQEALLAIERSMRQGSSKSPELLELERRYAELETSFTRVAMKHELLERALSQRPSQPGKSSR